MSKIALVQTSSNNDFERNLKQSKESTIQASHQGAQLVAFPESFLFLGSDRCLSEVAEPLTGKTVSTFQELALKENISILMGGFFETNPENPKKVFNTSILIDKQGEILGSYRKIHLFDSSLEGVGLHESNYVAAGKDLILLDHEVGKIGLTICYDIRFPMLFQTLTQRGAEIIFVPAAFTYTTGQVHWLSLLKARAIENQVYIVAPGQTGHHNKKRRSWGHSMIIDPWGEVIADAKEEQGIIYGDIDLGHLKKIRQSMPIQSHKVSGIDQSILKFDNNKEQAKANA